MKPYYSHAGITIYHGDAREILPQIGRFESIITDPVWPNTLAEWVEKVGDPYRLFAEIAVHFPRVADRAVIHLGGASDPRFLLAVPREMPFLGVTWLRYALPSFRGRMMIGADVAYSFGRPPKGIGCVPSEGPTAQPQYRPNIGHPCPRRPSHVNFLVKWFGGESLIDPCCGAGTTLLAAKAQYIPAVGIDIEERWCELAAKRLGQEVLPLEVR